MKLHGYSGQLTKCCSEQLYNKIIGTRVGNQECIDKLMSAIGATKLMGYSLRYIYFIDPSYRERLNVPIIPFSKIDEIGAGMYKGENITRAERHEKKTPGE